MRDRRLLVINLIVALGMTACPGSDNTSTCPGKPALEAKQSLWISPLTVDFGLNYGTGLGTTPTYVGASPQGSATLCNYGLTNLTITGATLSADPAFKFVGMNDENQKPLTTLAPNKLGFIQLTFTPTNAKYYGGGTLTLHSDADQSNAGNAKESVIKVVGCAVFHDGGTAVDCSGKT